MFRLAAIQPQDRQSTSYEEESEVALLPVQKRYTTRLWTLQKALATRGDSEGAAEVEAELERLGTAAEQVPHYPIEGKWLVTYQSGAKRSYFIKANGSVQNIDANVFGKFTKMGRDVLLDFGEQQAGTLQQEAVLAVEQ